MLHVRTYSMKKHSSRASLQQPLRSHNNESMKLRRTSALFRCFVVSLYCMTENLRQGNRPEGRVTWIFRPCNQPVMNEAESFLMSRTYAARLPGSRVCACFASRVQGLLVHARADIKRRWVTPRWISTHRELHANTADERSHMAGPATVTPISIIP